MDKDFKGQIDEIGHGYGREISKEKLNLFQ